MNIIIKSTGEWTWEKNNKEVKLWDLFPCKNYTDIDKKIVEYMLRYMYKY